MVFGIIDQERQKTRKSRVQEVIRVRQLLRPGVRKLPIILLCFGAIREGRMSRDRSLLTLLSFSELFRQRFRNPMVQHFRRVTIIGSLPSEDPVGPHRAPQNPRSDPCGGLSEPLLEANFPRRASQRVVGCCFAPSSCR